MVIALTGHRPSKLGQEYVDKFEKGKMYYNYGPISKALFNELQQQLSQYKPEKVITGMAIGADQIWAHAALQMGIPVIAAVPFLGQESKWRPGTREWYRYLLDRCQTVVVTEGPYEVWKMQRRNEWMVDNSDMLIAVWDGSLGGTANCYQYAQKKQKEIVRIYPQDLV